MPKDKKYISFVTFQSLKHSKEIYPNIKLIQLQIDDKILRKKLHYLVFKNQPIYIRCLKSFGINLGEGTTVFYAKRGEALVNNTCKQQKTLNRVMLNGDSTAMKMASSSIDLLEKTK